MFYESDDFSKRLPIMVEITESVILLNCISKGNTLTNKNNHYQGEPWSVDVVTVDTSGETYN